MQVLVAPSLTSSDALEDDTYVSSDLTHLPVVSTDTTTLLPNNSTPGTRSERQEEGTASRVLKARVENVRCPSEDHLASALHLRQRAEY